MKGTSHARPSGRKGRRAVPAMLMVCGLSVLGLGGCGGGGGLSPEAVDYASFTENPADRGGDRGALQGRVVDPAGQPVAGAAVTLSGARRQAGPASFTTHTKNDGTFAIGNILAATYQLLITRQGSPPLIQQVKIPGGVLVILPDQVLQPGTETTSGSVAFDADRYVGVEAMGTVTVTDADLNLQKDLAERITVQVASANTDPVGETVTLTETGTDTGVFTGTFGFERPFDSVQATPIVPGNGKVGVYAEATVNREEIRVTYHDAANAQGQAVQRTDTAVYQEPYSTLSGVVQSGGQPVSGAMVLLFDAQNQPVGQAVSRSDGSYAFYDVPEGLYSLTAVRAGYQILTQSGIQIRRPGT